MYCKTQEEIEAHVPRVIRSASHRVFVCDVRDPIAREMVSLFARVLGKWNVINDSHDVVMAHCPVLIGQKGVSITVHFFAIPTCIISKRVADLMKTGGLVRPDTKPDDSGKWPVSVITNDPATFELLKDFIASFGNDCFTRMPPPGAN